MNIANRIIKAKVKLMDDFPFFGYLVLHLHEKPVDEKLCPTASMDYKGNMKYNPKFMEKLSDELLKFVVAHESMHSVLQHLFRHGNRHPVIGNFAADIVVNNMLDQNGFQLLPGSEHYVEPKNNEVTLYDGKITIKDIDKKFTESIYDELYKQMKDKGILKEVMVCGYGTGKPGKGSGKGSLNHPKSFDHHQTTGMDGDPKSKREKEEMEGKWAERMVEALNKAREKGKIPAGMDRIVDKILNKKLNWRNLLYKYITNSIPFDTSWKKLSKRSFSIGIPLPGPVKENIDIVVSVDTSGSVTDKELNEFLTEIISIGQSFNNIEITVIFCDAEVHETYVVRNGDIPKILSYKISGRGGTDHRPIGEWIVKNKPNAECIINLTDGYTTFYDKNLLRGDSIWVINENGCDPKDVPFGRVVKMEG